MSFCTNCGTNVGASIRFCTNCGTPQAAGSPANAPLLEFGEKTITPQQQSMSFSLPAIAPTSSSNKQFILMLCIAQIVAPLLFLLARAIDGISFEVVKGFLIPYLVKSVIGFLPFVTIAFIPKFQNDVQMKCVAALAAAVLGTQGLVAIDGGVYWVDGLSKILVYLSMIAKITGIGLAILLVIEFKINKSMMAEMAYRWRAIPGFLAVLFLVLDSSDKSIPVLFSSSVFSERSIAQSYIFFPVVVGACLLHEKYRQGAAAGLAVLIASSMIYQMASKILSGYSQDSFISLLNVLALMCCLAVIAPNSMFQQKQTSIPR